MDEIYTYKKETFINNQMSQYPGAEEAILSFIWDITNSPDESTSMAIINHYSNGYCYYFAKILESAFGDHDLDIPEISRKRIPKWLYKRSHIVFYADGICYDVHGVFSDYSDDELRPLDEMSDLPLSGFTKLGNYNVKVIKKGDCTGTISWLLYENGVVSLCGHGEMPESFATNETMPWEIDGCSITSVERSVWVTISPVVFYNLSPLHRNAYYAMIDIASYFMKKWSPTFGETMDEPGVIRFSPMKPLDTEDAINEFNEIVQKYIDVYSNGAREFTREIIMQQIIFAFKTVLRSNIKFNEADYLHSPMYPEYIQHIQTILDQKITTYDNTNQFPVVVEFVTDLLNRGGIVPTYDKRGLLSIYMSIR